MFRGSWDLNPRPLHNIKEGVPKGWDRASQPLNGSNWLPGLEDVTILLEATIYKLI